MLLSLWISVSQTFLLADPLWLRKTTTDSHILVHVNLECPDARYTESKVYISELIIDSCKYTPAA